MNRDYFVRPIQGSRSAHDYGRTEITEAPLPQGYYARRIEYALTGLIVLGVTLFGVWAACR